MPAVVRRAIRCSIITKPSSFWHQYKLLSLLYSKLIPSSYQGDYITGWPVAGEFGLAEVEVYCNLNVGNKRSRGGGGLFGF